MILISVFSIYQFLYKYEQQRFKTALNTEKFYLPDSTLVILNRQSSLSWDDQFNNTFKNVILEGEAYFEVKRATNRPFTVEEGNTQTTFLGTSFDIWQKEKTTLIDILSGHVSFESKAG
jgi:ferric-dicitrate binding protein FerR (iron transport regulator)